MQMILRRPKVNRIIDEKLSTIAVLMTYLENIYGINLTFDNNYSNHYKLIIRDKVMNFSTYNDVINALRLLKESEEVKQCQSMII